MVRWSHSHEFPHNISISLNVDGKPAGVAIVATDISRKCSLSIVGSFEHTVSCSFLCCVCKKWNLFGFRPNTNTSSLVSFRCNLCRVELFSSHDQCHIRWVVAMNLPIVIVLLLLGHIICKAFLHNSKSEWVSCSFGQRSDKRHSPSCRCDSASLSILQPDAVSMSDINKTCCKTLTQLSLLSVFPV